MKNPDIRDKQSATHGGARPRSAPRVFALIASLLGFVLGFTLSESALALPSGANVVNGQAAISGNGNTLTVVNTPGAIINWQQFSIAAGERAIFQQQSAQSAVLNRVVGGNLSQIFGTLQSNGRVLLINPNGILIGKGALIDVPGFAASTLNLRNEDFLAGRYNFLNDSGKPAGSVMNQGTITTPLGGQVLLIGESVKNEGIINAPGGQVTLAAGKQVTLADSAAPNLTISLAAPDNQAVNLGQITASGGDVNIYGGLIQQQGIVNVDSARIDQQGRIILYASDRTEVSGTMSASNSAGKGGQVQVLGQNVTLTDTAKIEANGASGGGEVLIGGDWQGQNPAIKNAQNTTMQAGAVIHADALDNGDGGKVVVWADGKTVFKGSIFARGGMNGGNGGEVETSGHQTLDFRGGRVDTSAPRGKTGNWLLDPDSYCFYNTNECNSSSATTWVSSADVVSLLNSAVSGVTFQATNVISIYSLDLSLANFSSTKNLNFVAPLVYLSSVSPLQAKVQGGGIVNLNFYAHRDDGTGQLSFTSNKEIISDGQLLLAGDIVFSNTNLTNLQVAGITANYVSNSSNPSWAISPSPSTSITQVASAALPVAATTDTTAAPLSITANNQTKTYDGQTYSWDGGNSSNYAVNGCQDGDTCNVPAPTGTIKDTTGALSNGKDKGTYSIALSGDAILSTSNYLYFITYNPGTLTVNALPVQLTGSKTYDGLATIAGTVLAAANLIAGDTLGITGTTALASKNVGTQAMSDTNLAGLTLDNTNYTLVGGSGSVTITPATLTLAAVNDTKTYDGGTSSSGKPSLVSGLQSGDNLTGLTQAFDSKNAGNRTLNINGYTLDDGNGGGNYNVVTQTAAGVITPLPISGLTGSKNYDGTTAIDGSLLSAINKIAGDDLKMVGTGATASPNVGQTNLVSANLSMTGADAANYQITNQTLTDSQITIANTKVDVCTGNSLCNGVAAASNSLAALGAANTASTGASASLKVNEIDYAALAAAEAKRTAQQRAEVAQAFSAVAVGTSKESLQQAQTQRHEMKSDILGSALQVLAQQPNIADLPACGGGNAGACLPDPQITWRIAEIRRYRALRLQGKIDEDKYIEALPEYRQVADLPPPPKPKQAAVPAIGRKIAVIVGINDYADAEIPALQSAVPDANAIGEALTTRYGYEAKILKNATRRQIVQALVNVAENVTRDDSVVIYYAGHGYQAESGNGYWLPADAGVSSPAHWLANNDIIKLIKAIPANQVALISDSCYSGTLVGKEQVTATAGARPEDLLNARTVVVMSSGGEEPVADEGRNGHSIFAWSLLRQLSGVKDFETGNQLFATVRQTVADAYPQVPQYGAASAAGYQPGGDFVVERRAY